MSSLQRLNRSSVTKRVCLAVLPAAVALTALSACSSNNSKSPSGSSTTATGSAAASQNAKFFPGKAATGSPINVALIVDSGGVTVNQPETGQAAQAAVQYANENLGGIAGHKIVVALTCQTKEDPAVARDCANRAVQAKVDAVVVTSTAQGSQMAPVVTKAGIAYVSASGAAAEELVSPNAYMWTGGFPAVLDAWAAYAKQQGYKSMTVYATDSPAVVSGVTAFGGPAFKTAGVTLKVTPIPLGTPDATPQVSAGLQSKPDAVGVVGDSTLCTSVLKALSTLGTKAARLVIGPCLAPEVVKAVGSGLNGAKVFNTYEVVGNDEEASLYRAVMAKYAPSTPTQGYAGIGYQGMLSLIRATQGLTGSVSAAGVIAAIKSASNVPLPVGDGINFTCDGKALAPLIAVCSSSIIMGDVQNGAMTNPQVVKSS